MPKIGDVAPESDILGKCILGLPLTISTNNFLPLKKESNILAPTDQLSILAAIFEHNHSPDQLPATKDNHDIPQV